MRELTGRIEAALKRVAYHVESADQIPLVRRLAEVYARRAQLTGIAGVRGRGLRGELLQRMAACLNHYAETDPASVAEVEHMLERYERLRERAGLDRRLLEERARLLPGPLAPVQAIAEAILGMLPALFGYLSGVIPYYAVKKLARRSSARDGNLAALSLRHMLIGAVAFPVVYGLEIGWMWHWLGGKAAIVFAALLVPAGLFARSWARRMRKVAIHVSGRVASWMKLDAVARVRQAQDEVLQRMEVMRDRYRIEVLGWASLSVGKPRLAVGTRAAGVLALLLLVTVVAYLLVPGASVTAPESYGLVIVIDGAKADVWKRYAMDGRLPNIKRLFIDDGVWVEHASTVFPTITGAGLPAVLTGTVPGRHGIPSLYFFDRAAMRYPVLYLPLEALDWNRWLSPRVKTIWEYFPGDNDAIAIGPALTRGADSVIPFIWNVNYKPMEYRAKLRLGLRRIKRGLFGGRPARITVAYNGWFDHMEHLLGATAPEMNEHYRAVDALVAEAVRLFEETMDNRERAIGRPVERFVALVSDHGHQEIRTVYPIDEYVRGTMGARILDKAWTKLFGVKLTGSIPTDFEDREIVVAAGEGHALLYFPTPVMRPDGTGVERLDWARRPGLRRLRDYPYGDDRVDVIAEATAFEDAVSFVVGKDWDTGEVHVFSHLGESVITREGDLPTRALYRYEVVDGEDPLGFAEDPRVRQLLDGRFHHADDWQMATYLTEYPDAPVQLVQAFDLEARAPDLYISAAPFVSIGDLVDGDQSASKHGGLTKDESWAVVAFHGTGISPTTVQVARNVDVVPTMLYLLQQPFDPEGLDGRVIPEILTMIEAWRNDQ